MPTMNYTKTGGSIVVQGRLLNGHHGTIVMEINNVPIHTSGSVVNHVFPDDFNFQEHPVVISARINPMSAVPEAVRVQIDDDGDPASQVYVAQDHRLRVALNIHA